jgi:hypothetical protein
MDVVFPEVQSAALLLKNRHISKSSVPLIHETIQDLLKTNTPEFALKKYSEFPFIMQSMNDHRSMFVSKQACFF